MSSLTIRELITTWGIQVDDKKLDSFEKKLANVKTQADNTGKGLTSAFERPRDEIGRFTKFKIGGGDGRIFGGWAESIDLITDAAMKARSTILGMVGAFAVGSVGVGGLLKLIGTMEQTEIAFETMIGDVEKAHKTLADLQQFAKTTPFNFADTAELSKRLLAFNFQAEELIPIMTSLGNIAAGVGKEKLPQLVLAFGQVRAAGKLTGAELRQFTEAGVPLISELSKTLGIAEKDVQNMVHNGRVGFQDVWKALQNVTGEGGRFNNLMARQSTSLLGMFSNLVDTIQLAAIDLGKRGLLGRSKEFLQGVLQTLETNREKIIGAAQAAIEITILGLEKLIMIGKGVWNVFQSLTQAVGGTRKAIELFVKTMAVITSGRLIFLLGQLTIGVIGMAKAWVLAGNAARIAKFEMLAIPLAIGAAVIGLGLIIEDIVGYFQGRKSITGLILGNLENIGDMIEKILAPVFEKVKKFGASVGRSIIDGIFALSQADWQKFGDVIMKALEVMSIATTIPLRIGLAIAEGIITGLTEGIKTKFPEFSKWLGLGDKPILPPPGKAAFAPQQLGAGEGAMELFRMLRGVIQGPGLDAGGDWPVVINAPEKPGQARPTPYQTPAAARDEKIPVPYQNPSRPASPAAPSLTPAAAAPLSGPPAAPTQPAGVLSPSVIMQPAARAPNVTVEMPVTVTVPPGTPADQVAPALEKGLQKGLESVVREIQRANKFGTEY